MLSMDKDKLQSWLDMLYRPLPGRNPDTVNQRVLEDEMASFGTFRQEVGRG